MKRIHYLLLGLLVSLTIAAVSPTLPPTRIIAGNSTVVVVTNGVNNFTLTASGGVGTSNGLATNLTVYSSGTTNRALRVFGTNGTSEVSVDNNGVFNVGTLFNVSAIGNLTGNSANLASYVGGSYVWAKSAGVYWGASQDTYLTRTGAGSLSLNVGGGALTVGTLQTTNLVATNITADTFNLAKTITAPATTGNQTINKAAGRVNIAAAGTTVVVTCSLVTANSIIIAVAATADATARVTSVVPAAGSFTINTVATTAETAFNFFIVN
jgi:hypothetical protein